MTSANTPTGDQAWASVLVAASPEEAFRLFTEEIDTWWRRGLRYRVAQGRSVLYRESADACSSHSKTKPGGAPCGKVVVSGSGNHAVWCSIGAP